MFWTGIAILPQEFAKPVYIEVAQVVPFRFATDPYGEDLDFVGDQDYSYMIHNYTPTRSRAGPDAILKKFNGYLQAELMPTQRKSRLSSRSRRRYIKLRHARSRFLMAKPVRRRA